MSIKRSSSACFPSRAIQDVPLLSQDSPTRSSPSLSLQSHCSLMFSPHIIIQSPGWISNPQPSYIVRTWDKPLLASSLRAQLKFPLPEGRLSLVTPVPKHGPLLRMLHLIEAKVSRLVYSLYAIASQLSLSHFYYY